MVNRSGWTAALAAVSCMAAGLWAQDATESLLPRTQSRLKPVLVVAAAEMPIVEADEPVAPVAPSWSLPKPIKKASLPMTNPYVVPRSAR